MHQNDCFALAEDLVRALEWLMAGGWHSARSGRKQYRTELNSFRDLGLIEVQNESA